MVLYVLGEKDEFWHWCENCENYPTRIDETTMENPVNSLCPICYKNQQKKDCDDGESDELPPAGVLID